MSFYKKHLNGKNPNEKALPVNTPIKGREAEMQSSGGAGFAFTQTPMAAFKRWLVLGSTKDTMYRKAGDMSEKSLTIVNDLLRDDYRQVIETIEKFSVDNITPKQDGLLTALSMALSYEDRTVRFFDKDGNMLLNLEVGFPGVSSVFKIGMDGEYLFVHTHNKKGETAGEFAYNLNTNKWAKTMPETTGFRWMDEITTEDFKVVIYSKDVRRAALQASKTMVRQASQLFQLVDLTNHQRGWGRIFHSLIEAFYNGQDTRDLAYQLIKYGQRNNWKHDDLLRKVKIRPANEQVSHLFGWTTGKWNPADVTPSQDRDKKGFISDPMTIVWAAEAVRAANKEKTVVDLIEQYDLPREAIERADTKWLKSPAVWEALLQKMPANALVRNLRNMAEVGLIAPMSASERLVISKLENYEMMKRARVHPVKFMQAALSYAPNFIKNHNYGVHTQYAVSNGVIDALNEALTASFDAVEPTGKRIMISMDVSGSMWGGVMANAAPLVPAHVCAIMALEIARSEKQYVVNAFGSRLQQIPTFSKNMNIHQALDAIDGWNFGSTNVGLPIRQAMDDKMPIDGFIVLTDNEVNTGYHPATLIKEYRRKVNPAAKYVVMAMTGNNITVADPQDSGMADFSGFSTDTPKVIKDFIADRF